MEPERILRFTRTERALHWVHAVSFFAMLATGIVMFFSTLAEAIGRLPPVKDLQLLPAAVCVDALPGSIGSVTRAALCRNVNIMQFRHHCCAAVGKFPLFYLLL